MSGKFAIREKSIFHGDDMLEFGKHKGKTVCEVAISDPAYFLWMYEQDSYFAERYRFLLDSARHLQRERQGATKTRQSFDIEDNLDSWMWEDEDKYEGHYHDFGNQ